MVKRRKHTVKKSAKAMSKRKALPRKHTRRINYQEGAGFWSEVDKNLKKSKILSKVGKVVLPAAGSAIGTYFGPGLGTAAGAAVGDAGAEWLKSSGYGKKGGSLRRSGGGLMRSGGGLMRTGGGYTTRPKLVKRTQFATGHYALNDSRVHKRTHWST
jgi:hypothetical protein